MSIKTRNIVSLMLMLLIVFSNIGFNIISTFCDGCTVEQTTIALTSAEQDIPCQCCETSETITHCCSKTTSHTKDHHKTKSVLAQLKFDSPEAKSKTTHVIIPVVVLQFLTVLVNTNQPVLNSTKSFFKPAPPNSTGRFILSLICVLRN